MTDERSCPKCDENMELGFTPESYSSFLGVASPVSIPYRRTGARCLE